MARNDFKIFDESQINTLTQAEYETDSQRINGVTSGLARSSLHNKALHQATIMAAAMGQLIMEKGKNAGDQDFVMLVEQLRGLLSGDGCYVIADNGAKYRIGADENGFYWELVEEGGEAMSSREIDDILYNDRYDDVDGNARALSNAEIEYTLRGGEFADVDGNAGALSNAEIEEIIGGEE